MFARGSVLARGTARGRRTSGRVLDRPSAHLIVGRTPAAARILVAGASGVLGRRVTRRLVAMGSEVTGVARSAAGADLVRGLGASARVCDVFDATGLRRLLLEVRPTVVIHELTDLPDDPALVGSFASRNARMRRVGTRNLIDAARAAGVERLMVESVAWDLGGDARLAVEDMEDVVIDAGGTVLRYGQLYGEGTYWPDSLPPAPRVHVEAAAERTVDALGASTSIVLIAESQCA